MKVSKIIMSIMCISAFFSCQPGQKKSAKAEKVNLLFPQTWESKEKAIKGGTYKVAVVSQSPFMGLFNEILANSVVDTAFLDPISAPLFTTGKDFMADDRGLAKIDIDVDNKIVTVTLRNNLKWEDGQPMTIDDYIFTYECIGNPDYTGVRYDSGLEQIKGMKEFHEGKAKTISGLEKVNDNVVKIHFYELSPTIRTLGGGIFTSIIPKHYLADVPVKDLEKSDKVRLHPIGAGPWKIKQIIPGESVEYVPNENYYKPNDIPKVDKMIMKILPDNSLLSSMKNGEFDYYKQAGTALYSEYKDLNNLVVLGRPQLSYSYLGFNLGHWDAKKGENVTDPNKKMADINLRKAMGYAVNLEEIATSFFNGLQTRATGVIPPAFETLYTPKERFKYSPEKANELLDKAGYKDVDGDGIREDKNGKPLEIFLAFPASGDIAEPLSQKYIQDWRKVGLKVSLTGGRLIEGNSFFDLLDSNSDSYDIWLAGWSVGTSMDINGLYARNAKFNMSRITSKRNDELMAKVNSTQSLKDPEYKAKALREWEDNYMENELGFLPLLFRYELFPVNKRVKFSSIVYDDSNIKDVPLELTSPEPYRQK